ncbi:AAA family ATPase [Marispirochaeta aestuarii]|uniref:AAA family ATPase n=1 Tax=Marispirochaeta aestuarii TaxID=1963862 RepID=UPI0029C86EDC|nr:AAA family ATPase [Marispirochaeta aestuarii]
MKPEVLSEDDLIDYPLKGYSGKSQIWTPTGLYLTEFPEPTWIIPNILPAGLSILAGAPKLGKSWFALNIAVQFSCSLRILDKFQTDPQKALYLALEDTPPRLQNSLLQMDAPDTANLLLATNWTTGIHGYEEIRSILYNNRDLKLVIVDTLKKMRDVYDRPSNYAYDADYEEIGYLKEIADQYNVAILVITHTRKAESVDFLQSVSGTMGITGAADTVLALTRSRTSSDAVLSVTGRDIEEAQYSIGFCKDTFSWKFLGNVEDEQISERRQAIFDFLKESGEVETVKRIREAVGGSDSNISHILAKMCREGIVYKPSYGKYALWTPDQSDQGIQSL